MVCYLHKISYDFIFLLVTFLGKLQRHKPAREYSHKTEVKLTKNSKPYSSISKSSHNRNYGIPKSKDYNYMDRAYSTATVHGSVE